MCHHANTLGVAGGFRQKHGLVVDPKFPQFGGKTHRDTKTQNKRGSGGDDNLLLHITSRKEAIVKNPNINYETLVRITKAISTIQDPEEIVLISVEGVTHALNIKGCTLFFYNEKSCELRLAAYYGLSDEYIDKGPVSAIRSIASSIQDKQPVAIYDVSDDPRIQYADAAVKEGIASILSTPIIIGDQLVGCLRVYTAEPWEFSLNDVNFVQAVSQVVGMALEMCRVNRGLRESVDILEMMQDPKTLRDKRRTPYEGVPKSFTTEEMVSVVT